jgi:spermidine synthase
VTVHSWPEDEVVFVNLFTTTDGVLIPSIPSTIQKLFGVPPCTDTSPSDCYHPPPRIKWSYKLRGFRVGFAPGYNIHEHPYEMELALDYFNHIDYVKTSLVSEETDFQHVDIYEIIRSSESFESTTSTDDHDDGSSSPGQSLLPSMYRPDKILFLDGVQQSSYFGDAAYHEALVHPAMIAHPNPRRVAIIGGGEGATLREVLKHNTVREVTMVDIDGRLIELCREYMPEWSDCSDLDGSDADSCFDDTRASVEAKDAFGWFIDSFGGDDRREEQFDVIIMDALDPDDFIAIVGSLYNDNHFVESLYNGLSDNGVVSVVRFIMSVPIVAIMHACLF